VAGETIKIRKDVASLEPWDDALVWYARAVDRMQHRKLDDPTSWEYQAAVHGRIPERQKPGLWDQCQHQTWFFLPWHRGYIARFEQIVAAAIEEMHGPSGWALPYWNYSDVRNPNARVLPQAFRDEHLPDGSHNSLLVRSPDRHPEINAGEPLGGVEGVYDVDVSALDLPQFEADPHGGSGGFGGPDTRGFHHSGGRFGELEQTPHGAVHVDIGGLMRNPDTAALDPIFWLHHANIDRLWEIWRNGSGHSDPTSPSWRNLSFTLHDATGQVVTFSPADVLDTTAAPWSYQYDDLRDPRR